MNFSLFTALLSSEPPPAQALSRTTPGNNGAPSSEALLIWLLLLLFIYLFTIHNSLTNEQSDRIESIQKRALKIICGSNIIDYEQMCFFV